MISEHDFPDGDPSITPDDDTQSDEVVDTAFETVVPEEAAQSMDALWSVGVGQDQAEAAERDMLPSSGSYHLVPPFTVEGKQFEAKDDMPARRSFTAFGEALHIKTGTTERLRFRFSPDLQKRQRDDGTEDYDGSSKLYLQLRRVYNELYEHNGAVSPAQIKEMLESVSIGAYGSRWKSSPGFSINSFFKIKSA